MGGLLQDIRFRLRSIAHHPATTIVAVLSLALGIGANSAVFSLVDGMFLRPWSVEKPDELVWVRHRALEGQGGSMAYADYLDVREQNTVFSGLVAESRRGGLLKVGGETNLVLVNVVSENFFEVLGVDAAVGRAFSPERDADTADPGVILGHSLWTRRFGQDPEIIGQSIELTGQLFPVVGVMPPSFRGLARMVSVDLWVSPATWVTLSGGDRGGFDNRGVRNFDVLGRLRPDAPLAEAEAQLITIAGRLEEAYPGTNRDRTFYPLAEATVRRGQSLTIGLLLMSVVGVVLLIACANVATLLLADAEARGRETVVRMALGAGRLRLVRQFLTESFVLAALAMIAGILIAYGLMQIVPALMPPGPITVSPDLRLDQRVLSVTFLASMITLFLFGLVPALQSSRQQIVPGLKGEEARIGERRGFLSLRNILVVCQMALCVALIVGAGLVVRSFLYSQAISPGFDTEQDMLIALVARSRSEQTPRPALYADVAEEIESLPGVRRVTWARRIALSGSGGGATRLVQFPEQEPVSVKYNQVAPDYFEVMGTRILRGRPFSGADRSGAAPVAMVNETMAAWFWPDQDPLGQNVRVGDEDHEIVAIVEDGKINSLHEDPEPFLYFSYAVAGSVRQALRDREASVSNLSLLTLDEHMRQALYADRLPAQIGGALGALGVLLAAIGLFGVISRLVNQRQREFGIRMALGARRASVLKLVLSQGLKLSLVGIAIGIGLALVVGRLMASSLHTRVDPMQVLRNE